MQTQQAAPTPGTYTTRLFDANFIYVLFILTFINVLKQNDINIVLLRFVKRFYQ